ncbi:Universal stress protein [Streptomyces sp. RB5]|uniref:Universal stress protein n=1 Tax=Streptomyces smaragdinus TaxID=2585196 RepID=A0A7K0CM22_9ACTN|nr:universal stress protein [Streptomyces smaragdinus]MQY14538.1 Universal stress protein [Streptomyces smaragdinus]
MTEQQTPRTQGRVVVGYDGSAPAERALTRAIHEAERREAGLEIILGAPWTPFPPPALGAPITEQGDLYRLSRESLDTAADRARKAAPDLEVVATLSSDPAAEALIEASRTAGLTVVGTRGHGGFTGLLLGSVSLRVAAHTHGPLLVVRGDAETDSEARDTVVAGVQGDADAPAVRYAFEEAQRRDARLRVLHAWTYPAPLGGLPAVDAERTHERVEDARKLADAVPRYAAAPLRDTYPLVRVDTDHELGAAASVLVNASKAADLVVLAAHRGRHRFGMQLGPVTHALLHHSHAPVLLLPVE